MEQTAELPSIMPTIVTNIAPQKVRRDNERRRVLVIDDDPVVRKIVLELLNNRFTVITASTGVQLPELLQMHKPDLIILDVMLPWLNGFELCRIIKTHPQGHQLPVLFLTGCNEKDDILTGKEVGGAAYLTKPFYAKDLFREVDRLLAA